jgi:predicted aspartyl protease
MNKLFLRASLLPLVAPLLVSALCLAATLALGTPISAHGQGSAAVDAATQAHGPQDHVLPSMFREGDVFIKVSVNGHPAVWMNLDTGTTDSVIDSEYAKTIGLRLIQKSEGIEGFGAMKTPTFTTDTVRLKVGHEPEGEIFFESIRLGGMVSPDGVQLAGLLGHSFLDKHVVVIDYKKQQVYFEEASQPNDPRDVAITLIEGVPCVTLKMAGRPVRSLIDSGGSYGAIITPALAKELGIEGLMDDAKLARTIGHGGDQHVVVGKAPRFSIGELVVDNLSAAYTDFGTATNTIGVGMSLGKVFLRTNKVTLNYKANTARFEP